MKKENADILRQMVRGRYAQAATAAGCGCRAESESGCCGSGTDATDSVNRIMGYSPEELDSVVEGANLGLGCGNPTAIGELRPGDVVLDLGSGGGFDCFLAAKKVGDEGLVIGVDMTPEMLSKARENAAKMGATNVDFRLGEIEHLPVADSSVDVIISNCVINLSPEKKLVFEDAYRVLKPGGRLFVSDVVATAEMPDSLREQAALMTGCIAGAEHVDRVRSLLEEAGFQHVQIDLKAHSKELVRGWFPQSGAENYVASADIVAVKPTVSA
ncbi:MAG: arsenite methyltransferase [Desulfobacteraceae bacterium]|jgi:ubiquinone/menaquinone biosynthesis C-methylase UbiE|nr:arsenite methyltransferase [Desulfobacteraceae bacterium]